MLDGFINGAINIDDLADKLAELNLTTFSSCFVEIMLNYPIFLPTFIVAGLVDEFVHSFFCQLIHILIEHHFSFGVIVVEAPFYAYCGGVGDVNG